MKNYDQSEETNDNRNWSYIPNYPCGTLIITGSRSGKLIFY